MPPPNNDIAHVLELKFVSNINDTDEKHIINIMTTDGLIIFDAAHIGPLELNLPRDKNYNIMITAPILVATSTYEYYFTFTKFSGNIKDSVTANDAYLLEIQNWNPSVNSSITLYTSKL